MKKWLDNDLTCPMCLTEFEDQLHILINCNGYCSHINHMTQSIAQIIRSHRKYLTVYMIYDIRIPGTNTYINQYNTYHVNNPNNIIKRYKELLGLLTTKYTDKLCNLANFNKPQQVIHKIANILLQTLHKIWLDRCHINTLFPQERIGVGG
jgi:hypothetical protein